MCVLSLLLSLVGSTSEARKIVIMSYNIWNWDNGNWTERLPRVAQVIREVRRFACGCLRDAVKRCTAAGCTGHRRVAGESYAIPGFGAIAGYPATRTASW